MLYTIAKHCKPYGTAALFPQLNPRRAMVQSRGDTIVSLLYAAAAGDLSALKRHKVKSSFLGHALGRDYF